MSDPLPLDNNDIQQPAQDCLNNQPSNTPHNNNQNTLAALWGTSASTPIPPQPQPLPLSSSSAANTSTTARKRRKKEDAGPAQGRLVFSTTGFTVAAPPPEPAPVEQPAPSAIGSDEGLQSGQRKPRPRSKAEGANGKRPATSGTVKRPRKKATVQTNSSTPPPIQHTHLPALFPDSSPPPDVISLLSPPGPEHLTLPTGRVNPPPVNESAPQHPFFSRSGQADSNGTGSPAEPIVVPDTSPLRPTSALPEEQLARKAPRAQRVPTRLTNSDPSTPVHSFFSKKPEPLLSTSANTPALSPNEVTATSGTSTPTQQAPQVKAVHSFFKLKGHVQPGQLLKGWGSVKEGEEPMALWPGDDWPSHVGADTAISPGGEPRRRRQRLPLDDSDDTTEFWSETFAGMSSSPAPLAAATTASSSTTEMDPIEHAAISAVLNDVRPDEGREQWSERHRPRNAVSVIGNKTESTYLRDWLSALSLGKGAGYRVVRRVPKASRIANPELAWIVDDIGLFGNAEEYDEAAEDEVPEPIPEPIEEPLLPLGQRPDAYPPISKWIANTILLTGPTGTGKTAAVHAAATELGWDVFQVYPGVGKLTGPHLLSLVGDVGRNHMVSGKAEDRQTKGPNAQTEGKPGKEKRSQAEAAKLLFGGRVVTKAKEALSTLPASQGSVDDPIAVDDDGEATPRPSRSDGDRTIPNVIPSSPLSEVEDMEPPEHSEDVAQTDVAPRQSLILLDEADIHFDGEEATFWPAVVSLIAESRRPVVITCNDPSRIPTRSLPLQTTLHFRAPPRDVAEPYLAAIAKAHNVQVDVCKLYEQCSQRAMTDLIDRPLPPNGNEPAAQFDLRAAIAQLQLDRSAVVARRDDGRNMGSKLESDLAALVRQMDTRSFADAAVGRRPWAQMEMSDIDRHMASPDDEEGLTLLCKPDDQARRPVLAAIDRSEEMANTLLELGGGKVEEFGDLQLDQTAYIRSILPVLDPLVSLHQRLLPDPTLFLETMPIVRSIVRADDIIEAADRAALAEGRVRVNRRTGRLMRATGAISSMGYVRWISLEEGALEAARSGGLEWRD